MDGFEALTAQVAGALPASLRASAARLARAYGTDALRIAATMTESGETFGHGLTEAELRWLIRHEWARTAEDVLWRRSKLGLLFTPDQVRHLDDWMSGAESGLDHNAAA